jgi:hypothetical protein
MFASERDRALSAQEQQQFALTMTEAKWPSGDRHFYAIAISRWDNEGGATQGDQQSEMTNNKEWPLARAADSLTSAMTGGAVSSVAHNNKERA